MTTAAPRVKPDGRNPVAIPVSIITGFLGSGKTTLLNRLMQDPALANSLVIINEFGEIGIDHLLVSTPIENMRLLGNGCLCCVVRGDLVDTLADAARQRRDGSIPPFDRVLVETTGLADPVPIMQTVVTDQEVAPSFRLDTVIGVVDAVNAGTQFDHQAECGRAGRGFGPAAAQQDRHRRCGPDRRGGKPGEGDQPQRRDDPGAAWRNRSAAAVRARHGRRTGRRGPGRALAGQPAGRC